MENKNLPSLSNPDVQRFDKWAKTYDGSFAQIYYFKPVHSRMLDLIGEQVKNSGPGCIIDVGCGTGRLLRLAALRWPDAQLIGVDPAPQMVAEATRLNPKAVFKVAAAESLPFTDASADLMMTSLSFHHWADQAKGISEAARVLRPGGFFCLADHTLQIFREKVRSKDQVRQMMASAGLQAKQQVVLRLRFVVITLGQKAI